MSRHATKLLRWNRQMITRELGMDARTIGKRLVASGLDGRDQFSTREVFDAMLGDLTAERTREAKERADKLALENAQSRAELVSVRDVAPVIGKALESIKATITAASNLEAEDKEKIIVACRQCYESAFLAAGADAGRA